MKAILLSLTLLCPSALWGQSFLHLTSGQSYSYEFSTVPFSQPGALLLQGGSAIFYLTSLDPDPASQVQVEMFEGRLGETLLQTEVVNTTGFGGSGVGVRATGAWQDLEGSVRLTVLRGAVDLTGIRVVVATGPLDFNLYGYRDIVPVPEPSTWALLGAGLVASVTWTLFRGRRDTTA